MEMRSILSNLLIDQILEMVQGDSGEDLTENIPAFGGDVGDYDSQGSYNMVLQVHPNNADLVFLGGTNLYRSSDGFDSHDNIDWIGGYDTAHNVQTFPNHFVDQHALFSIHPIQTGCYPPMMGVYLLQRIIV